MIKAIIFDCFGVLYGGSLETLISMAPAERRQDVWDVNLAKDYGYITYQEYTRQIGEITGATAEQVDQVVRINHAPNQELLDYAMSLRNKYKTALLSNIGDQTIEGLFGGKVEELFTTVILSYKEGIAKPSPEIFQLAAERLGVSPGECVMIDDVAANCEGAEVAGMQSIQHISNATTLEKLATLLEPSV